MKIALGTKPNNSKHFAFEKLQHQLLDVLEQQSNLLSEQIKIFFQDISTASVICEDVGSIVPAQPWGINITRTGAEYRAKEIQRLTKADISIGVENGIWGADSLQSPEFNVEVGNTIYIDAAWICILFQGRAYHAISEGIVVPIDFIMEAQNRIACGENITVGKVIAEYFKCDHDNWHVAMTNGFRSRKDILASAFFTILTQISP